MQTNLNIILNKSLQYLHSNELVSYDPFDALTSPILKRVSIGIPFLERIIIKVVKESPVNLRLFLGIKKKIYPNSISHLLSAKTILYHLEKTPELLNEIQSLEKILISLSISCSPFFCWGLNFPYSTRYIHASSTTPNLFTTINCANAFLDSAQYLNNMDSLEIARKSAEFAINELGYVEENECIWFRYYPGQTSAIINVNALLAGLLARLSHLQKNDYYMSLADKAVLYICKYQNSDGSWYYANSENGKWIDGFHTGYILEGLAVYNRYKKSEKIEEILKKGLTYYRNNLLSKDLIPKYYSHSLYPIDSQNCAQAIQTLSICSSIDSECLIEANKVFDKVKLLLFKESGDSGYFIAGKKKHWENHLFYLRWAHAPMILAMVHLKEKNKSNQVKLYE